MRALWVLAAGIFLARLCAAAEFNPFEGPAPLVVLIASDPWAMVLGADTPRVAIYENGDVIYVKAQNRHLAYRYVHLDKAGLEAVRQKIAPVFAVTGLKPVYRLTRATDQPSAMFYFKDGNREVATEVYGRIGDSEETVTHRSVRDMAADIPPHALLDLYDWLCGLDYSQSSEWTPRYVEVMLWDYSYAPERSIQWPKEWPSLTSERVIKRGDSYSIFLDGSLQPALERFLATRKPKGAVEVDGRKMAVSYRAAFPGEPIWRKTMEAERERDAASMKD